MPRIDLVTGFLGSGKTTFIRTYADYLIRQGLSIGILENDYGAVNVDMMMLQDLPEDRCELEMVAGGCDYDCHRRRFKTKLIAMGMSGYDVVIVEPSGIYDTDEFFDVLREEPLDRWYTVGNVIALMDVSEDPDFSEESDYLLFSQVFNAGKIILTHAGTDGAAEKERALAKLIEMNGRYLARRDRPYTIRDFVCREKDGLTDEDLADIAVSGYVPGDHGKQMVVRENDYASLCFMNLDLSPEEMEERIAAALSDPDCGRVIRVKGFCRKGQAGGSASQPAWAVLNATRHGIRREESGRGQDVMIVIGENLNAERLDGIFKNRKGNEPGQKN